MMISTKKRATLALLAASTLAFSACAKDEFDPQTWIEKLDNASDLDEAITKLKQLKCPEAIKPLGKVWERHVKRSKILRIIIDLADQPEMVAGYKKFPDQDCPDAGEGPYWDDAIPFLVAAVQEFDVTSNREIDDATIAIEALGRAKSPDAVQALISAATKKEKLRQGQKVRIAAVKALGGYGDTPRTVETIIGVLEIAPSPETIYMNKAAAQALAEARSPSSVVPLLKALYNMSPIYHQIRTALTNIGKPATVELLKAFKGEQPEIKKLASDGGFAVDCDKEVGLGTGCIAPGNVAYKAALLLGDLRAKEAIPAFTAALKQPEKASFYVFNPGTGKGDKPGPSDHVGVLTALRNMGAYEAAGDVSAYMQAESTKLETRAFAIDVYSKLARDASALGWVKAQMQKPLSMSESAAKKMKDQLQDEKIKPEVAQKLENALEVLRQETQLRQAAVVAYARLAKKPADLAPFDAKIKAHLAAATKQDAVVAKEADAKRKTFLEKKSKAERKLAGEFEQHKTRAQVGILCQSKLACYQEFLSLDAEAIVKKLKIPNHADAAKPMKRQAMEEYRSAALERALLEISKMGKAAEPAFDQLLKHADSSQRIIREGVLLALIQVAPSPCNACAERLNKVLSEQKGQTTLENLNSDTRIILNYFINQGAKLSKRASKAAKAAAKEE